MIRVRNLSKRFGSRRVLDGIDVETAPGEPVAIFGESGAGKTTFLRCLNYLEPFDEGEVEIAGFSLRPALTGRDEPLLRRLRCAVGMVFQQLHLFPHLSVLENVALAPRLTGGVSLAEVRPHALELLARVGLADRADARPSELSGGQQQRVAIARALATRPKVLLFDEPTSALDAARRDALVRLLRELADGGITLLVVTHDPAVARGLDARTWSLEGGRIAAGPADRRASR